MAAVEAGRGRAARPSDAGGRMLRLMERVGALRRPGDARGARVDRPEHRALIRRAAQRAWCCSRTTACCRSTRLGRPIAVIGPNAAEPVMGGGSAQVNAHYRSARSRASARARGTNGVTHARAAEQPLIARWPVRRGGILRQLDFQRPVVYAAGQPRVSRSGSIADGVDQRSLLRPGHRELQAEETARIVFGLASAGRQLFVDGPLVVDTWDGWQRGANYFGTGSVEVTARMELAAGRTYEIVVDYRTPRTSAGLGCAPSLRRRAARRRCDRRRGRRGRPGRRALLFVGRNGEWDSEGRDLPDGAAGARTS